MDQAPLMEVHSSTVHSRKPTTLKVFEDAVWVHHFNNPKHVRRQRVRYGQIAQVRTQCRIPFSALVIETRGGDTLKVDGLSYVTAKSASLFIEQRLRHSDPPSPSDEGESHPAPPRKQPSLAPTSRYKGLPGCGQKELLGCETKALLARRSTRERGAISTDRI